MALDVRVHCRFGASKSFQFSNGLSDRADRYSMYLSATQDQSREVCHKHRNIRHVNPAGAISEHEMAAVSVHARSPMICPGLQFFM